LAEIASQIVSRRLVAYRGFNMIFPDCRSADTGTFWREQGATRALGATWVEKLFMLITLAAGSAGLAYFAGHVAQVHERDEHEKHAKATTVRHYAAVRVWLPQTLIEVARRRSAHPPIRTHEEVQRILEVERLREVWYALTIREHHDNGGFNDLTVIRRPYDDPRHFSEFPHVLAAAAGKPADDPTVDFSLVSVTVVPEDFRDRTPHEVIGDALRTVFE
jgi:hypothetical protein